MSIALSVRLPEEVMRELEEVASLLDRPKTHIVHKALEPHLEENVDYLVALERLRDKDDRIISGEGSRWIRKHPGGFSSVWKRSWERIPDRGTPLSGQFKSSKDCLNTG